MMKGGRPSFTIPKPWKAPIATPSRIVSAIATGTPKPCTIRIAVITLQNPTTAPTDRSMPAVMITNVCPTAMMATMEP